MHRFPETRVRIPDGPVNFLNFVNNRVEIFKVAGTQRHSFKARVGEKELRDCLFFLNSSTHQDIVIYEYFVGERNATGNAQTNLP